MNSVNLFFVPVLRHPLHNITACNCDLMKRHLWRFSRPKLRNYSYLIAARIDSILWVLIRLSNRYTALPIVNAYDYIPLLFQWP